MTESLFKEGLSLAELLSMGNPQEHVSVLVDFESFRLTVKLHPCEERKYRSCKRYT